MTTLGFPKVYTNNTLTNITGKKLKANILQKVKPK